MNNKGFTIVESLVAISILVLVIIGVTGAIQKGIYSYTFSKDQIIAFYLAQEGFEQIRNLRDENGLRNQHWLANIAEEANDPCYFGSACRVDLTDNSGGAPTRCSSPGNCPFLRQDATGGTTGFFGYTAAWPVTVFKREIMLTEINPNEISVSVTINWLKGGSPKQFKAKENLFNWQ